MSSTYTQHLPEAFPYFVQNKSFTIKEMAEDLLDIGMWHGREYISSFALTADAPEGYLNLWLSPASKEFLETLYPFEHYAEATNAYTRE